MSLWQWIARRFGRREVPPQIPDWDLPLWAAAKLCPEAIRHRDWMLRHGYLATPKNDRACYIGAGCTGHCRSGGCYKLSEKDSAS